MHVTHKWANVDFSLLLVLRYSGKSSTHIANFTTIVNFISNRQGYPNFAAFIYYVFTPNILYTILANPFRGSSHSVVGRSWLPRNYRTTGVFNEIYFSASISKFFPPPSKWMNKYSFRETMVGSYANYCKKIETD